MTLLKSMRTQSTTAAGNRISHRRVNVNVRAPVKVTALFTTKKAKEEREGKDPNNNNTTSSSTPTPLISVDMFERQGFRLGAFTKTNELFIGRMAMLGIASSILGEILTGKGALGQLGLETGLPVFELDWTIFAVVGLNLVAAIWPSEEDDAAVGGTANGKGMTHDGQTIATNENSNSQKGTGFSTSDLVRAFSIKRLASKDRELWIGRVAQLGFAASLLGEGVTGKGILAQFKIETGVTLSDLKPYILAFVLLTLLAAVWEDKEEMADQQDER